MICSNCKENDRSWSCSLNYKCDNTKCENCYIRNITVCCNCLGEFINNEMEFDCGYCLPCSKSLMEELMEEEVKEVKLFPIFCKKKVIKKI